MLKTETRESQISDESNKNDDVPHKAPPTAVYPLLVRVLRTKRYTKITEKRYGHDHLGLGTGTKKANSTTGSLLVLVLGES